MHTDLRLMGVDVVVRELWGISAHRPTACNRSRSGSQRCAPGFLSRLQSGNHMSLIRGVLLAGQFRTQHQLNTMSAEDSATP
jgi:hypothetical protein